MVQGVKSLIIYGRASQKEIKNIIITTNDLKLKLMDLLQTYNIPVASSCNGDGICLKCTVTINDEKILSCQYDIADIFKDQDSVTVVFSYL